MGEVRLKATLIYYKEDNVIIVSKYNRQRYSGLSGFYFFFIIPVL